jgi:hypothetical protein
MHLPQGFKYYIVCWFISWELKVQDFIAMMMLSSHMKRWSKDFIDPVRMLELGWVSELLSSHTVSK